MATAGTTPPIGDTPKPKREFTTQQKRTFAGLGIVGLLTLIVGVMYLPGLLKGAGSTTPPPVPPSSPPLGIKPPTGAPVTVPASPTVAFANPGASVATAPVSATTPVQPVVFVSRSRIDPFKPVYLMPPLAPTPVPTIPAIPDPIIPLPRVNNFGGPVSLPAISDPRVRAAVAEPLNIGSPSIPRPSTVGGPRDAFPLPRTSGGDTNGAPGQSYDKRLAGVIIGDGVRALLELPSGEQRVVQPGDDVEGIHVVSIERTPQGGNTVTRMLVRDTDGSQKYVELRPSTQSQTTGGAGGTGPGAPGG